MRLKKREVFGLVLGLTAITAIWAGAEPFGNTVANGAHIHSQVKFPTQPVFIHDSGSAIALRECGDDSHCGDGMVCNTDYSNLGYCDYPRNLE